MTPRALLLCTHDCSGISGRSSAAPPVSEDLPVSTSVATLAQSLGLNPALDRPRFMSEIARIIYSKPDARTVLVAPAGREAAFRVPVPLTAAVWSKAVFRRTVPRDQLVTAIVQDRQAALLCYALAALDDETLTYLSDHSDILTNLYQHAASAFAAFGASLRIRGGRVEPPGGADARPLWESVVRQSLDRPEQFIRALFEENEGRIGYLYNVIARLDSPHARFALGAYVDDPARRAAQFALLAAVCLREDPPNGTRRRCRSRNR